jgi:hypothetical protein
MNIKLLLKEIAARLPLLRNNLHWLSLLMGVATYIPALSRVLSEGTGGTISARYCYSVWLRHLTMAYENGLSAHPDILAELGPGDSLGIGLAALLSGANKYYSLDVVEHAGNKSNMEIFDELVDLFKKREKIPDESEFPNLKPCLKTYEFPAHILTGERLNEALKQSRIESIRNALSGVGSGDKNNTLIHYIVPWNDSTVLEEETVDMVYSQSVLEHVNDPAATYNALYRWLKPGGFMSHVIDFRSHVTAKDWNGHWACSDSVWRLIKGKRPYLLNRQPHSVHINLMQTCGLEVICDIKTTDTSGIERKSLSTRFHTMSDDDLITSWAFIQAVKKAL